MDYFKSFDVALHDNLVKKCSTIQNQFTYIKCSGNQLAATSACFYSLLLGYLTASKELIQLNIFISDLEENINSADNFANYTRIAGKERMERTQ